MPANAAKSARQINDLPNKYLISKLFSKRA